MFFQIIKEIQHNQTSVFEVLFLLVEYFTFQKKSHLYLMLVLIGSDVVVFSGQSSLKGPSGSAPQDQTRPAEERSGQTAGTT